MEGATVRKREQQPLPVSEQRREGHLTRALIGWQQLGPIPLPLTHSSLLINEQRVLFVINQS